MRLIPLSENTGFCGAVNQGIKKSSSPLVILLNNDTIAEKNFVEELVKGMESKPRAFSCQAKLLEMRHQDRVDDAEIITVLWAGLLQMEKESRREL